MGLLCWIGKEEQYEFGTDEWAEAVVHGATCLLPDGHDGPHEWTSDDDFVIKFAAQE